MRKSALCFLAFILIALPSLADGECSSDVVEEIQHRRHAKSRF